MLRARSTEGERVCPHCGCDRWKVERLDKTMARMVALDRERERLAQENGLLRSEAVLAKAQGEGVRRAQQRRVQRQARVIRRLERRLLELGQQPHEGASLHDVATVSDIPEISE